MQSASARWFRSRRPPNRPRLRLLCLPYAGGGATIYHAWRDELPADVDVRAVQLPGRQDRLNEPALTSVDAIIRELIPALMELPPAPLLIYGHSFGALIAFELARSLLRTPMVPRWLIVGARQAPHLPSRLPAIHQLNDVAFKEELHRRYGTPLALLRDSELMALAISSLRADITAVATYQHKPGEPLDIPITVLHGRQDISVSAQEAVAWQELSARTSTAHEVDADHLFVDTHRRWVLSRVTEVLRSVSAE